MQLRNAPRCWPQAVVSMPFKRAGWLQRWGWKWLGGKGFGGGFREPRRSGWSKRAEMASAAWGSACGPGSFASCCEPARRARIGEVRAAPLTRLFDSHDTAGCGCKPLSLALVKRICGKWCPRGQVTGSLRAESTLTTGYPEADSRLAISLRSMSCSSSSNGSSSMAERMAARASSRRPSCSKTRACSVVSHGCAL